jgi:hypothetical protein
MIAINVASENHSKSIIIYIHNNLSKKMTTLGYAPFDKDDNIVTLTDEESKESGSKFESMKHSISDIEFTCPETLEQLWNEVDILEFNTKKYERISKYALLYMVSVKHDNLLHVYSKIRDYGSSEVYRWGDLVLGIVCQQEEPVEIYIGGVHKFTKQCKIGVNAFTREEIIPMVALCYQTVEINGKSISNIIYGTILSKDVKKQLIAFYSLENNPSLYHNVGGLDMKAVNKRKETTVYSVIDIQKTDWMASELKLVFKSEEGQ